MASTTRKQQRFFFAELGRAEKGQETKTDLPISEIREFTKLKKKKKKAKG